MRAALLLVAIGWSPAAASPQPAMESYFDGEKRGGLILVGMGAAGVGAGALLVSRDSDLARGAGYPALGIGVVHLAAGVFVYVTSARRVEAFTAEINRDPAAFIAAERERMQGVRTQFLVLKIVEGALIAGGAAAVVYGLSQDDDLVAGIGLGVAAEATATLLFDIVADRRAVRYLDRLGIAATPGGAAAILGGSF